MTDNPAQPAPNVVMRWTPGPPATRAERNRLLTLLFGPRPARTNYPAPQASTTPRR